MKVAMDRNSVLMLLLAAAISFLFWKLMMKKRKRLPPGPARLPILGSFLSLGKDLPHWDLYRLSKKHGPIMYLQVGCVSTVVVSSPSAAEKFLKTYDSVFADRPYNIASWYITYEQRDLIFAKYGPYWRAMRKLCISELMSNLRINQFQPMRREEIWSWIESMRKFAAESNGGIVDLSVWVASLMANMSCLMVFGKKDLEKEFGDERGFKDAIQEMGYITAAPHLAEFFPLLNFLDLEGHVGSLKILGKVFDNFLEKMFEQHVQNKDANRTKDFVDAILEFLESRNTYEFEFDRRHAKSVVLQMFIGLMDTSSSTVEWVFTELLRHPQVLKKLQQEIEEKVGLNRTVEESDLEHLTYLDMVIKEALRVHPVAPLLLHAAMEDCTVDGYHIPKNTRIIINTMAIGRDPNEWDEPDLFFPERFIGKDIDVRGHHFMLLPFGSGRRMCPGMQLGLTVVRIVVAQLVHCFDWELANGMKPSDLDVKEACSLILSRQNHIMAIPTYRLHSLNM